MRRSWPWLLAACPLAAPARPRPARAAHAHRALHRADAGEPLLRQLLRHLPRRRRHPEGRVHAVLPARDRSPPVPAAPRRPGRCGRGARRRGGGRRGPAPPPERLEVRQAPRPRRALGGPPAHAPGPPAPVQPRPDGRLSRRAPKRGPRPRPRGDGLPRGARPSLLLERGRPLRPVRPLLPVGGGGHVAESHVLAHRHGGASRPRRHPAAGIRRPPDDLRPARGARDLVEVLHRGLRPAAELPDRKGQPPAALGAGARVRPLHRRPEAQPPHRRSGGVLHRPAAGNPPGRRLHRAARRERASAPGGGGRPALHREPHQRVDAERRNGRTPRSCGATTTGEAGTTT